MVFSVKFHSNAHCTTQFLFKLWTFAKNRNEDRQENIRSCTSCKGLWCYVCSLNSLWSSLQISMKKVMFKPFIVAVQSLSFWCTQEVWFITILTYFFFKEINKTFGTFLQKQWVIIKLGRTLKAEISIFTCSRICICCLFNSSVLVPSPLSPERERRQMFFTNFTSQTVYLLVENHFRFWWKKWLELTLRLYCWWR